MKKIAYALFNHSAKKFLRKNKRNRKYIDYDKARKIIFLFDYHSNDDIKNISKIIDLCKKDGKEADAVGFRNEKNSLELNNENIHILTKKNTNIFGKPEKKFLEKLQQNRYDILIDLSVNIDLPLLYTALYTDALFKAGTHLIESEIYDFILNVSKLHSTPTTTLFFNEIIFYLKRIKTND